MRQDQLREKTILPYGFAPLWERLAGQGWKGGGRGGAGNGDDDDTDTMTDNTGHDKKPITKNKTKPPTSKETLKEQQQKKETAESLFFASL